MTFVHSFWSKPLLNNKFNDIQTILPVVLTDYAVSASFIHKYGHSIKLYADKIGIELLKFIPYDEIIEVNTLDDESIHFAAQIKFEALKKMSLDEILIDGDLFMRLPEAFDRLNELGKNNDFVYSMFEPNNFILSSNQQINKYQSMSDIMKRYSAEFIPPYRLDRTLYAYQWPNTSLMLFNNQQLKDEYIRQYEYYKKLLSNEDFGVCWPDIIIEQRHMHKLLNTGYTSAPMIDDFPSYESNKYALKIGFTHLGYAKIYFNETASEWLKTLNYKLYTYIKEFDIKKLLYRYIDI